MADLANHAAALAAGYVRVQGDRGATASMRFFSRYEKPMVNDDMGPFLENAMGESNSSQAAADTAALTVLNAQRAHRHGITAPATGNLTPRGTRRNSPDN